MTTDSSRLTAALSGHYRIEKEIGAGGMATVYLAEDLKHHRKVAIKVLREDLAANIGPARFLREIEIAAQLQHPHILPLLDSGEAEGFLYYVMPFVAGHSLRERLTREVELPIPEAVRLITEVVDALVHAHELGVVHRDIKPDNVMISGRHVLVTDFGVAKAISEATGRQNLTTLGVALGTPAYMSPEQATADPHIDHRSDIYSVGALAYELLTGRPPFVGTTPQQVLAAHVTEVPEAVGRHRPGVSAALEHIVMRCLAKRPADRFQTASELLAQLEPLATPSGGTTPTALRLPPAEPARRRWPVLIAGLLAIAAAVLVMVQLLGGSGPAMAIGRQSQLTADPGLEIHPSISPDGKFVAYAAGNSQRMRIFIRPVGGGRTIPLSDDSTALESNPRWSPDGSQLLFLTRGGVSIAPALGGSARAVMAGRANAPVSTAAWSPDGRQIAFARGDSLWIADLNAQGTRFVAASHDLHSCSWSPNQRWIACVSGNSVALSPGGAFGNLAPSAIVLAPAVGGAAIALTDMTRLNQSPEWSPDSRRVYFVSNRDTPRDLYVQDIASGGRPRGAPIRLTTGANIQTIALSKDESRFAYSVYVARSNIWSVAIPTGGPVAIDAATPVTTGTQIIESLRVSSDGRWLLYDSNLHGNADIYRIEIGGGQPEQLTFEPFDEFGPDLSPDGRAVAYHSLRSQTRDIEVKPLDGGPVEIVTSSPAQERFPRWSPADGRRLSFMWNQDPDPKSNGVYLVQREAAGRWSKPLLRFPGERLLTPGGAVAEWSPDGRSLVFMPDGRAIHIGPAEPGDARTVYVPDSADPIPERPSWSPDGVTLYFKSHDAQGRASLWSIPATGGRPRLLVRFTDPARPSNRADFASDGTRFFFTIDDRQSDIWVAELTRR